MSNAIRFLETLGRDPALSRASPEHIESMIAALDITPAQRDALMAGDASVLSQLAGGRDRMKSLIWEPGREQSPEGDEPDSENEEAPDDEDDQAQR